MAVDQPTFLILFPEFSDGTIYTTASFNAWLTLAPTQLNSCLLGANYDFATMLFIAHNLVMQQREAAAATTGKGIPGESPGVLSSKTIGPLSMSFDGAETAIEGAGAWNATSYGQRLYKMFQAAPTTTYLVRQRRRGYW